MGLEEITPTPIRFTPYAEYTMWWAEVEACSGLQAPMGRVRWYYVPNRTLFFEYRGESLSGLWFADHRIVLSESMRGHDQVVRHEMLHDLIGIPGHPSNYFIERCGSLVSAP